MKSEKIFLIIIILITSCKNIKQEPDIIKTKEVLYPYTINVEEAISNNDIPLLSSFSDNVLYVKLKTPKDIIVKLIRDVQISKDNIFIHEGLSEKVMVFDMEGNFLRLIGKRGRGPNEYINLISFCIDKNNEDLLFYTGNSGNVLKYSLDGTFIGRLFKFSYADYMYSLNDIFIFSGITGPTRGMPNGITQFATVNMSGEIIDSVPLPIYSIDDWRKKNLWFPGNFPSIKFDKTILLYGLGEDTIFHVTDSGNITPRYHLEFGKYKNPVETRYIAGSPEIRNQRNNYITAISPPVETSKNLWCKFAFQKKAFLLRLDKVTHESFSFFYKGDKEIDLAKGRNSLDELGLINDIDGGPDFFPEWSVYSDSTQLLISAQEAFDLKKKFTPVYFENRKVKFPDKKINLLKLVNNLDEKDDYVLMIIKLK